MMRTLIPCIVFTLMSSVAMAAPFVRIGAAVKGPHRLAVPAAHVLADALAAAELPDPVTPEDYNRAATRLRIHRPFSSEGVRSIGQHLHITHVVVVEIEPKRGEGKRQLFAEATLYDVSTQRVLFRQRYFLPDRQFTDGIAKFILDRVLTVLHGNRVPDQDPDDDAEAQKMHAHEIDVEHQSKPEHKESDDPPTTATADDTGADAAKASIFGGRAHYNAGVSFGKRRALLTSAGSTLPVCYCSQAGGYGAFTPGLHAQLSFFFDPNTTNFGVDADAYVELASTSVAGDANKLTVVRNPAWRLFGALAYRIDAPLQSDVHFQLGYTYARFALAAGAFPGLAYAAPFAGLQLAVPLGTDVVALTLSGAYMPFVSGGLEAKSLGNPSNGRGWRASGGLRASIGNVEISALAAWETFTMSFSGTTALYAPVNFANVALNDQHLDFSLSVGSRF